MTRNWGSVPRRNWGGRFRGAKRDPLTVEKLAVDCLDVRELQRHRLFRDYWVNLPDVAFRWPKIERMRVGKHLILLRFWNQITTQQIRVSWTPCYYGGARP